MTVVTKDATSGSWIPQSAAEYTSLLSGTGISNPASLWNCQTVSGNLTDLIGSITLTATNSPTYGTSVPGWSSKALSFTDGGTACFQNTTTAPDPTTTSIAFLTYAYVTTAPGTRRYMVIISGLAIYFSVIATGTFEVGDSGQAHTTAALADGVVRPIVIVLNRAASTCKLYTPTEIVSTGFYAGAGSTITTSIGSVFSTPTGGVLYASQWAGTAAELDDAHAQTLIDRLLNGPAYSSIAITPSSALITTVGGTQALVATGTRVDTSTGVLTSVATWSSSNPSVATVSSSGVVTAVSTGTTNITCTYTSLNATAATSNTVVITVNTAGPTLKKLTMTPGTQTLIAGNTKQASIVGTYSDNSTADITGTALWSAQSPSIASVGTKGLISAISVGTSSVVATPGISAYPQTAAAMATAVGYGTWGAGYMLDETTGSLNPVFGSPALAAVGTPTYSNPGPLGAGDYAVGFSNTANDGFNGGNVFPVGANDLVFAWVAKFSATPPNGDILVKYAGSGGEYELRVVSGAYRIDLSDGTNNFFLAMSTAAPVGVWHIGMVVLDRGAGKARIAQINLDGTGAASTAATTPGSVGTITSSANMYIGSGLSSGVGSGACNTLLMSACWINTGANVAQNMSANLPTAVANLASCLMASCIVTTAPYLSSIDHVLAALSRLPSQFQKPKIQNLIRALAYPANELEQVMWAVLTQRSITNALGAQLDTIGGIVGQDRNGLNDDDYRRYIAARVIAERSHGNIEDLYAVAKLVVSDSTVTFALVEDGTATIRMRVFGAITDAVANILWSFLHTAVASGVRIIVEYSTVPRSATFTLDAGPGLDVGRFASQIG